MNQDTYLVQQFEKIFKAHFSSVKFFIFMFLKSEADSEDLAQDVFVKLWTNFETWIDNDGKDGYIYTIAKNVTLDFIKHKRLEDDYRDELIKKNLTKELFGFADPLNSIYCNEIRLIIRMALERFPKRRRKIFEMSRLRNMSNHEIAETLHLSLRTIEHQIYLSLKTLKKIIIIIFFLSFL
ncbi:RNA polymerase sigma-70 factor [Bacteroides cellulosilyticus]|uniref:RNA polymerase sigma-70 factor n=1 Tax=Bacteroides cellulosilyticus TaxID=246787 RepID=UPI0035683A9D